ncbi:MAG: DUF58 domain-containing protein [Ruminococcaceae bacterium]|nr:DUF58 domain-containing protein [Oscillospiraceae bacterium]
MVKNRICYLACLVGVVIFYLAYRQWLGWLLLVAVLCLPILSLLLSLPALFTLKLEINCPKRLKKGEAECLKIKPRCFFPIPVYDCRAEVTRTITAERFLLRLNDPLPTEHCGILQCSIKKCWAYDYLGLFRFRMRKIAPCRMTVLPQEIPMAALPPRRRGIAQAWKPKPGGGFGENHEIRLYRPGDHLTQIHWKLTAKTNKLMIREPMVPVGRKAAVTMCITGTAEELDVKFGRLLGICNRLLLLNIPHDIYALTAEGLQTFPVEKPQDLSEAVEELLGAGGANEEQGISLPGVWVYRIGGDAGE